MSKETKYQKPRSYEAQRALQDLKNAGFTLAMCVLIGVVLFWLRQHQ